jgi:hypothetical protein
MFRTLIAFWRAHKSRSRVTAVLAPHLTRWRRDGGNDADLETPVALGFLTTLIAALAQRFSGELRSDALGNLQADLWNALTGLPSDTLGERIVSLSIAGDPGFARGCRAALLFDAVLARIHAAGVDGLGAIGCQASLDPSPEADTQSDLATLWNRAIAGEASPD